MPGGTGDYVTLFEPTASLFEQEGKGYVLASVGQESGEIPYTAYFANSSYIEKNPEVIQKFTNAIARAQQWITNGNTQGNCADHCGFLPGHGFGNSGKGCETLIRRLMPGTRLPS